MSSAKKALMSVPFKTCPMDDRPTQIEEDRATILTNSGVRKVVLIAEVTFPRISTLETAGPKFYHTII
jgi:hypothetical protein